MWNFVVSIRPADGLALLGVTTCTGTVMTKLQLLYMYKNIVPLQLEKVFYYPINHIKSYWSYLFTDRLTPTDISSKCQDLNNKTDFCDSLQFIISVPGTVSI